MNDDSSERTTMFRGFKGIPPKKMSFTFRLFSLLERRRNILISAMLVGIVASIGYRLHTTGKEEVPLVISIGGECPDGYYMQSGTIVIRGAERIKVEACISVLYRSYQASLSTLILCGQGQPTIYLDSERKVFFLACAQSFNDVNDTDLSFEARQETTCMLSYSFAL